MSSFSWVTCFIWLFLPTFIGYQGADGIKTILSKDECIFQDSDGKTYNITALRNDDGRTARFRTSRHPSKPQTVYQYSFNPCISFSLGPKTDTEDCQSDVAICRWITQMHKNIGKLKTQKFVFYEKTKIPALQYKGDDGYECHVLLKCDQTKKTTKQATFEIWKDIYADDFVFNLTHKCACPDACLISPSEPTTKDLTNDMTITVVEIAVPAGVFVLILALIVIWLVRKGQDNNPYQNIDGENGGAGVDHSENDFPDTSEGTSGRGSASVTMLSPTSSSCSDITVPNKEKKDNLNSKIKTYTEAPC